MRCERPTEAAEAVSLKPHSPNSPVQVMLSFFGENWTLFCPASPKMANVPALWAGMLILKETSLYLGVTSTAMLMPAALSSPSVA